MDPRSSSRGTIERSAIGGTNRRLTFGEARTEGSWLSKKRIPLSSRRDNRTRLFVVKFDPRVRNRSRQPWRLFTFLFRLLFDEGIWWPVRKIVVGEIELCILIATIYRLSLSYPFICAVSNGDSCGCNRGFSLSLSKEKNFIVFDRNRMFHRCVALRERPTCSRRKFISLINYFYFILLFES